jgi:hypothetical protein
MDANCSRRLLEFGPNPPKITMSSEFRRNSAREKRERNTYPLRRRRLLDPAMARAANIAVHNNPMGRAREPRMTMASKLRNFHCL